MLYEFQISRPILFTILFKENKSFFLLFSFVSNKYKNYPLKYLSIQIYYQKMDRYICTD